MDVAADFARRGFAVIPGVADAGQCARYAAQIRALGKAGSRTLLSQAWCAELADSLLCSPWLQAVLPVGHVAVQCTSFEKSGSVNWLVPVHQDLSIPVHERVEDPVLRGWSCKEDGWYAQPPSGLLEQMVAVRLHLDPCCAEDGPVHVVPGSHQQGAISPHDAVAMRQDEQACLAQVGDVLIMRPLLLHRSSKATGASRRRVLHFLFGPAELPHGLEWPQRGRVAI
ncbi:phytanoyl-CoA dioxygenase family protein [Duganella sp. CF458]|uniref:phytanoyl-CoA dioxygenase family protein n=1 Tax=Duganella sp. CF458 TaxID=1884368 RepID=UPI000B84E672|nr:phytanoyl-CoA dioxygenase family protein [Duganella sp. CF458]